MINVSVMGVCYCFLIEENVILLLERLIKHVIIINVCLWVINKNTFANGGRKF